MHEVRLDEGGRRDGDRIAVGQRDGRLERRDGVIREGADRAAGEPRHALDRQDPAARHELADRRERVRDLGHGRSAGPARTRAPSRAASGCGRDRREPRGAAAARRRGTSSARRVRRPRRTRGGTPARRHRDAGTRRSGVSRSAGRVARSRTVSASLARRLVWARLSGSVVVIAWASGESQTTVRPGTKGRAFRGATLIRRCRTLVTDGLGRCRHRRRSALPCIAGALRRSLLMSGFARRVRSGGSRVHSPSSSSRLAPAAGSLGRRATGTRPVHSPFFVMWPGVWAGPADGVKRPAARVAAPRAELRSRRSAARAAAGSADSADPSASVRTGRTCCPRLVSTRRACRHVAQRPARECRIGVTAGSPPPTCGGEGGIRTHGVSRLCAFQERRHQPLGHLSGAQDTSEPRRPAARSVQAGFCRERRANPGRRRRSSAGRPAATPSRRRLDADRHHDQQQPGTESTSPGTPHRTFGERGEDAMSLQVDWRGSSVAGPCPRRASRSASPAGPVPAVRPGAAATEGRSGARRTVGTRQPAAPVGSDDGSVGRPRAGRRRRSAASGVGVGVGVGAGRGVGVGVAPGAASGSGSRRRGSASGSGSASGVGRRRRRRRRGRGRAWESASVWASGVGVGRRGRGRDLGLDVQRQGLRVAEAVAQSCDSKASASQSNVTGGRPGDDDLGRDRVVRAAAHRVDRRHSTPGS